MRKYILFFLTAMIASTSMPKPAIAMDSCEEKDLKVIISGASLSTGGALLAKFGLEARTVRGRGIAALGGLIALGSGYFVSQEFEVCSKGANPAQISDVLKKATVGIATGVSNELDPNVRRIQ